MPSVGFDEKPDEAEARTNTTPEARKFPPTPELGPFLVLAPLKWPGRWGMLVLDGLEPCAAG
jgi:hypothetical protein